MKFSIVADSLQNSVSDPCPQTFLFLSRSENLLTEGQFWYLLNIKGLVL